jgi:DNA invertase Pin-like site-specific DNA recombinase
MKYTIAKYLRISAEDIDLDGFDKYESNSIQNQRALLDDFIGRVPEFAGCEVIEELDDGRTGTNFSRPGVQRLIELAKKGKVQCIVVKDLSRWGRSYLEVGDYLEQIFPELGVRFISLNDAYDSATLNGGVAGIDIAFRNLIYEMYSQDLSEKVRTARISAAKSGKVTASYAFYGYIKDPKDTRKLLIDEPSADVVRRIFELAAQGNTPNQIAKMLNDEGVQTAQQRQKNLGSKRKWTNGDVNYWYGSVVSIITRDERYTGKLICGKTQVLGVGETKRKRLPKSDWIVVPGAIPAIITDEQFKAARGNIESRYYPERKQSKSTLLFSRKLKCGHCGLAMRAVRRANDVKYHCDTNTYTDGYGCSNDWAFEKDIAAAVLAALQQQILFADEARKMLETRNETLTPSIEALRGEASGLKMLTEKSKSVKMNLWEQYRNSGMSAEAFQRENEKADDQAKEYAAKIVELESEILNLESETGRENVFVERFSRQVGITELTRAIVEEFISEIKVYSADRIEVVFNFADEYEKIVALADTTKTKRRKSK